MKNFIKEHTTLSIVIVSILLLFLIVLGIILMNKVSKEKAEYLPNEYIFADKVSELKGTKTISNANLKKEQCIDNICVSNVAIYSTKNEVRVECTITNKGKKRKSGRLQLNFGNKKLTVSYMNLSVGDETKAFANFYDMNLQVVTEYTLEKAPKVKK